VLHIPIVFSSGTYEMLNLCYLNVSSLYHCVLMAILPPIVL